MSLAVEVDLDVQPTTECFNVATEAADLGTGDTASLQCTHPLLGDGEQVFGREWPLCNECTGWSGGRFAIKSCNGSIIPPVSESAPVVRAISRANCPKFLLFGCLTR
jgi:hypothetical protein